MIIRVSTDLGHFRLYAIQVERSSDVFLGIRIYRDFMTQDFDLPDTFYEVSHLLYRAIHERTKKGHDLPIKPTRDEKTELCLFAIAEVDGNGCDLIGALQNGFRESFLHR